VYFANSFGKGRFARPQERLTEEDLRTPVDAVISECGVDFVSPPSWCIVLAIGWLFESSCDQRLVACLGWKLTHNSPLKAIFFTLQKGCF